MHMLHFREPSWKSTLSIFPGFICVLVIVSKSKCHNSGWKELHGVVLADQFIVSH